MAYRRLPILLLAMLLSAPAWARDFGRELRSKDVNVRLAAVEELRKKAYKDSEKLLLKALSDKDWEVMEKAAAALGERGGPDSVKPLLKISVTGPVRRVRLAAARSLSKLDPEGAARTILKRMGGGEIGVPACEAFEVLAPVLSTQTLKDGLARGLSAKELSIRTAAARSVAALGGGERRSMVEAVLKMPETSPRAALLDALRVKPDPDDVPQLLELFHQEDLNDVLSRRVIAALLAVVEAAGPEEKERAGRRILFGSELAGGPRAAARFARLAGYAASAPSPAPEGKDPEPRLVSSDTVKPTLEFALDHESPEVRAAAAWALGEIGEEWTLDRAAELVREDKSARVRLIALRSLVRRRGVGHEGTYEIAKGLLAGDPDQTVRETAAVALGSRDQVGAVGPLIDAVSDAAWQVAVCAIVSLGKTRDERTVATLREAASHKDWKYRGAAIVAMGHLKRKEVVPDIIEALADKSTHVARTALETLRRLTNKDFDDRVAPWKEWWKENGEHFDLIDRERLEKEAKKAGYAPTYVGVYEGLDVIVLQSRGDHIEQLLDSLTISHRLTRAGQLDSAALHPYAIFVSNCTGEIVPKDFEPLQWFVRTGGYLFCSCWALHYTVEKVYPGVIRKLPTHGQVLENVTAERCPSSSIYLDGVFDGQTRPIYVLYGAHLIQVLDPERVEVLIDSPTCADTWGEGNLACWFDAGHGVVLDSVNHFDLQGLERAEGLKSAEDRMAYAMDHMGLSYDDLRELTAKKVWGSRSKAAAAARDHSAFRLITNFVRHKRRQDR